MARLILDTGVLVAIDRGVVALPDVIDIEDNVALPAVVVAEYLTGVAALSHPGRRASARQFLAELRAEAPVIPYDDAVAEVHAELLTHVRAAGVPRGAHDLIIAATARASERILVSTDHRARFDELPGVRARIVG